MAGLRSKPVFTIIALVFVFALYSLQSTYTLPSAVDIKSYTPDTLKKMSTGSITHAGSHGGTVGPQKIIHVVMFEFKPETEKSQVRLLCDKMLNLKHACIHPTTKKHYVKSMIGGRENSPEGMQRGITHVFVAEFENAEDRKYYLEKDPAHLHFVEGVKEHLANATVVDFTPEVW